MASLASCAPPGAARCRSTRSRRTAAAAPRVDLDGGTLFVAEGIFAPEIVAACREEGLLAAAYCITQHPLVTFWRRLSRDLREHRKPPLVLVRRGYALARDQRRVVSHALKQGCRRVRATRGTRDPGVRRAPPRSPWSRREAAPAGRRSCGAATLVMARDWSAAGYAAQVRRPWRTASPTRPVRCTSPSRLPGRHRRRLAGAVAARPRHPAVGRGPRAGLVRAGATAPGRCGSDAASGRDCSRMRRRRRPPSRCSWATACCRATSCW